MRRTKIVCTLGPATKDDKILRALIDNGMNVARQNFSHGTHESHKIDHDRVIRIAREAGQPVATLLDTKGPEVRLRKFKGGAKPITIKVSDFDRAAPHGTGHIKAGLNYAMSLHAIVTAHEEGYAENMYLDAATRTKVEETGGANFIFVTKDGKVVTPKSNSILPSITRRSILYVAEHYLGLETEEREVYLDEVKDFAECGLCGTAAVISPVGKIVDHGKEICFPSGMDEMGPVIKKLYETLTGIQMGHIEAPEGWIQVVE